MLSDNPLWNLELLQRAYDCDWILNTQQLSALLGITPKTVLNNQILERHGFRMSRTGKCGDEIAWAVDKVAPNKKPRQRSR